MQVLRLHPNDPTSWIVMPQVCERMVKFAREEYGGCPPLLVSHWWWHFVVQDLHPEQALMAVWVRLEDGLRVVGHVLAEVANEHGVPYLCITQTAVDRGIPFDAAGNRAVWNEIEAWGRSHGCVEVRTLARDARVARLDRRLYGLEVVERVPMRRILHGR